MFIKINYKLWMEKWMVVDELHLLWMKLSMMMLAMVMLMMMLGLSFVTFSHIHY